MHPSRDIIYNPRDIVDWILQTYSSPSPTPAMPVVLSGQPSLSPSYPIFTNNNGTLYNHNEATETLAASYGYTDAGQGGIGGSASKPAR